MARKTITYVGVHGRDKDKHFVITEKSAFDIERWAMRVLLAAASSGVDIPNGADMDGAAGLASVGLGALAKIKWVDAEPLMEEMLSCVKIMPTPSKPHIVRDVMGDDIEEVKTLFELRKEIFNLHVDFFTNAAK